MTAILDKSIIEKTLKELVTKEPEYMSNLLKELGDDLKLSKRKRLAEIVKKDFEEYGAVFKALA